MATDDSSGLSTSRNLWPMFDEMTREATAILAAMPLTTLQPRSGALLERSGEVFPVTNGEILPAPTNVRARRSPLPSADEMDAAIERKYGCAPYRPRQGLPVRP